MLSGLKFRQKYNLAKITLVTAIVVSVASSYLLYDYEASLYWNFFEIAVAASVVYLGLRKIASMQRYIWFLEGSLDSLKQPITTTDIDMNWVFINKVTESLLSIHGLDKNSAKGKHCSSWQADICGTEKCGIDSLRRGQDHTTYNQEYGEDIPSTLMAVDTTYITDDEDNKIGHIEVVTNIDDTSKLENITKYVSSSLVETSASLEQISQTVSSNLKDAESANKMSSEIFSISEKGDESMQKLISSMDEIKSSNERIQEVVGIIQEIEDKTKAIDEIVFQTKLLSFNASVEAERAGEHGRGFSVVAQEVGNLAQLSGKSASEINEILKESITRVKSISDDNSKKVQEGTNSVLESANILKAINTKSTEITDITQKVFESSKEQKEGIKVISSAVSELDREANANLKSIKVVG